MQSFFLPVSTLPQAPNKVLRINMSQVDSSSHTFKKSSKPLPPVPLLQVNYSTTSKTLQRHSSVQDRGNPRHIIKRYVRITPDPKSHPKHSPKCSPFKQTRVQPLIHLQDSVMYKLEDIQDRYKRDMSRLVEICQEPLNFQRIAQTRASSVLPSSNL